MTSRKNLINKGKDEKCTSNTYALGLKGQDFVELKFDRIGYAVYRKNLKKIGLEVDLIVYKFIEHKNLLTIRVVEVKTRRGRNLKLDLEQLGIKNKWRNIRKIFFDIPLAIKKGLGDIECKHSISFDLAVVEGCPETFKLNTYIRNVNLLL